MSGGAWSPDQYERFKDERSRPFFDLLGLVKPRAGMRVVDLGCGTGELTRALHRSLDAKETVGVDSSETMLEKAAAFAGDALRFERATIEAWAAKEHEPFDVVFSNAALHWVEDHRALLPRLASSLAPGGQIAVQIPSNDDHPAYLLAAEIAREPAFREVLGGYVRVFPNLSLAEYATLLDALGFHEQHVRTQVYAHRLASRDGVVEWVKGTLLTDYAKRMDDETFARFVERYREAWRGSGGAGPYFYAFKRTLFWGKRD